MNALQQKYQEKIRPQLQKELGIKNVMKIPQMEKVVINVSVAEAVKNARILKGIAEEFETITGQKPVITKAKKAIANFKLREGMPLGVCVTLRKEKMWVFLEKLIHITMPRVRDFRGLSPKGFDGRGNYNMGLKEQIVFPEVDYDKVDKIRGMNITIGTTAETDATGRALLSALGVPFKEK